MVPNIEFLLELYSWYFLWHFNPVILRCSQNCFTWSNRRWINGHYHLQRCCVGCYRLWVNERIVQRSIYRDGSEEEETRTGRQPWPNIQRPREFLLKVFFMFTKAVKESARKESKKLRSCFASLWPAWWSATASYSRNSNWIEKICSHYSVIITLRTDDMNDCFQSKLQNWLLRMLLGQTLSVQLFWSHHCSPL